MTRRILRRRAGIAGLTAALLMLLGGCDLGPADDVAMPADEAAIPVVEAIPIEPARSPADTTAPTPADPSADPTAPDRDTPEKRQPEPGARAGGLTTFTSPVDGR